MNVNNLNARLSDPGNLRLTPDDPKLPRANASDLRESCDELANAKTRDALANPTNPRLSGDVYDHLHPHGPLMN